MPADVLDLITVSGSVIKPRSCIVAWSEEKKIEYMHHRGVAFSPTEIGDLADKDDRVKLFPTRSHPADFNALHQRHNTRLHIEP